MRYSVWTLSLVMVVLWGCGESSDTPPGGGATTTNPDGGGIPDGGMGGTGGQGAGSGDGGSGGSVPEPPPLPTYSGGTCPTLTGGSDLNSSVVNGFTTSGTQRNFRFVVPDNYDGSTPWPLVFGWHVLFSNSGQFATDADILTAASEMQMLFVLFDSKFGGPLFTWPFYETQTAPEELVFFDDVLACVAEQYNIDVRQVYGVGGSAGGLWLTYLSSTERVNHLAALVTISGGLGEANIPPFEAFHMEFTPQPNKFPAMLVVGHDDQFFPINFTEATARYREALLADGHFVIHCIHPADGHVIPDFNPPQGVTKFWAAWQFMLDHPWGVSPEPYQALPTGFPDYCEIAQ